jgi:hypothetical protein
VLKVPEWVTFFQVLPKCVPDVFDCIALRSGLRGRSNLNVMGRTLTCCRINSGPVFSANGTTCGSSMYLRAVIDPSRITTSSMHPFKIIPPQTTIMPCRPNTVPLGVSTLELVHQRRLYSGTRNIVIL